jgi:Holliday junction DNA helicase RuvA
MIGRLTGLVEQIEDGRCLIDVRGVGYVVFCSARSLAAVSAPPALSTVLIETQVREDAITLYGFIDNNERDWFNKLVTVQGVGPKLAMAVLSALAPDALVSALAGADAAALRRVSGVGPNLAKRLVTELGAFAAARGLAANADQQARHAASASTGPVGGVGSEALSALVNLGYRRSEAEPAIFAAVAEAGSGAGLDAIIREALRRLAR